MTYLTVPADNDKHHQSINHMITYSVITSSPEVSYSSVLSTIRCHAVTAGPFANSTFVEWSANFSSDANAGTSHQSSLSHLNLA